MCALRPHKMLKRQVVRNGNIKIIPHDVITEQMTLDGLIASCLYEQIEA